ncbi:maltase A1 [Plutella xylostella]|uniref:maltase A1 n=1 Tax=Plutella xylostella TaxID=51655 RepID=UPI0020322958|nr:maltase A1 [Plutella xylostella]
MMKSVYIAFGVVVGAAMVAGGVAWAIIAWRGSGPGAPPPPPRGWWETADLYQIYPRSFKDSDGDGVGDLPGITSKLEHLVEAGAGAAWLSPVFQSPMVDAGYDVSDFYSIHEEYGKMEDFEQLVRRAHELGLKVLLDFVPNHASTESQYFKDSEDRVEGFEDFFVWADGLHDPENESNILPPSNWVSQFGGSAWQWSEKRGQFYLHQFSVQQADFNFRSPAVRDEMLQIMRFWLDKGADGFRIDGLPYLMEANPADHGGRYPDDPLCGRKEFGPNQLGYTVPLYTKDLIELYDIVYDWREFVDNYQRENGGDTRVILTEGYTNISMTMQYYGYGGRLGAHFPFNFGFITDLTRGFSAPDLVYCVLKWLTYMPRGAVANWVLGNHDNSRVASRLRPALVDGLNALTALLPGASVTYQGEELGMRDGRVSWRQTVDVEACSRGNEQTYQLYSRDPARTPFHWDGGPSAGFSSNASTWLPVASDHREINLERQKKEPRSHFKVFQALKALRKRPTLTHGDYIVEALSDKTLVVVRHLAPLDSFTLVFNVAGSSDTVHTDWIRSLKLPATVYVTSLSSKRNAGDVISPGPLELQAGEALVLQASSLVSYGHKLS